MAVCELSSIDCSERRKNRVAHCSVQVAADRTGLGADSSLLKTMFADERVTARSVNASRLKPNKFYSTQNTKIKLPTLLHFSH